MVGEILRVPNIGFVPPRELSFIPEADVDSPLVQFIQNVLMDRSDFYWAVYHHTLLNGDELFSSQPVQGETRHSLDTSFPHPIVLLSMLSHLTQRNELFTDIMIAPQVPLGELATQFSAIANNSRGRFVAGLASGWNEREFEGLGVGKNFHHRGSLLEQKIPALEMMLTGIPVNLTIGEEKIVNMGINPKSNYPIPIWLGGGLGPVDSQDTLRVLERAAKFGDGWMPMGDVQPFMERKPIIENFLHLYSRDPQKFGYMGRVTLGRKSIDDCVDDFLTWIDAGATHVTLTTVGQKNSSWKYHAELIHDFLRATEWIRSPHEPFYKSFATGYGWKAPQGFHIGGADNFQYFFMRDEINPRFLKWRLRKLGYQTVPAHSTHEIRLPFHGEQSYTRSQTYIGSNQDQVGIFERQTNRKEIVVFYQQ